MVIDAEREIQGGVLYWSVTNLIVGGKVGELVDALS